jgi:hypothetical protein
MDALRHHRSPRWLNARMRIARLTIPQWMALAAAGAVGVAMYLALTHLSLLQPFSGSAFYLRLLLAGAVTGLLGVLLYALADDRREPFIRQAVFYLLRRHHYERGAPHGRTRSPRLPRARRLAPAALARTCAFVRRRGDTNSR